MLWVGCAWRAAHWDLGSHRIIVARDRRLHAGHPFSSFERVETVDRRIVMAHDIAYCILLSVNG